MEAKEHRSAETIDSAENTRLITEDRMPTSDQITLKECPQDCTKQAAEEAEQENRKCAEQDKSSGKDDSAAAKTEHIAEKLKSTSEQVTPEESPVNNEKTAENESESASDLDKTKNADQNGKEEKLQVDEKSPWLVTKDTPYLNEYFQCKRQAFVKERGLCRAVLIFSDFTKTYEPWKVHFVSSSTLKSSGRNGVKLFNEFGADSVESDADRAIGAVHVQVKDDVHLISVVAKEKSKWYLGKDPERTLANMVTAMESLKKFCVEKNIKRIAMERFFANHERVNWRWTQSKLLEIFADVKIDLAIYKPTCFWNKYRDMQQLVKNLESKTVDEEPKTAELNKLSK